MLPRLLLWLLKWMQTCSRHESDWNVGQIERQMSHQIELHARLGPEGCRLHACGRLPDWVLPQIGQIGFSARLPDWGFLQIGAFFSPNPCQTFAQAGRQIGLNARLLPTLYFCLWGPFPDWSDWVCFRAARLDQIELRARLSDWARQIGARLTSTTQWGVLTRQKWAETPPVTFWDPVPPDLVALVS